ncbi:HET-domain-containing protein [Apiospora saccharicola]
MRLLAVNSFLIKDFIGDDTPPYAILSHTWGPGEVTLQDMHIEFGGGDEDPNAPNTTTKARASTKEGFRKIRYTCEQAAKDDLEWAWVDTCCIDKTSSAELSEAINSMYRWYNQAKTCYAYLTDVTLDRDGDGIATQPDGSSARVASAGTLEEAVAASRWLTRGFTLQELLAPSDIVFYNVHWTRIGTRNEQLRGILASTTGIDYDCLGSGDHARLANYSIATRMSWASRRSCTRTEDVAYCLMGIFDINMPMLYSEGKKAFVRLQEEILKETEDHSLFAWAVPADSDRAWCLVSILAESPSDFAGSGNIKCPKVSRRGISALNKLGLSIELGEAEQPPKQDAYYEHFDTYEYGLRYFTLNCSTDDPNDVFTPRVIVPLLLATTGVDRSKETLSFCRFSVPRIESAQENSIGQAQRVYIRKNLSLQDRAMFQYGSISFRGLRENGVRPVDD